MLMFSCKAESFLSVANHAARPLAGVRNAIEAAWQSWELEKFGLDRLESFKQVGRAEQCAALPPSPKTAYLNNLALTGSTH